MYIHFRCIESGSLTEHPFWVSRKVIVDSFPVSGIIIDGRVVGGLLDGFNGGNGQFTTGGHVGFDH